MFAMLSRFSRCLTPFSRIGKFNQIKSIMSDGFFKLAMPYSEFDVLVDDIDEKELVAIGKQHEVEHLSTGAFSSEAFPTNGYIYGVNIRYMIPLVVQRAEKQNSRAVNTWFLVDTGSPYTCLTVKALEAIFGQRAEIYDLYGLAIQDQNSIIRNCRISKAHFKEVNILGADAMRTLKLSIIVDWEAEKFKLIKK